jgi:hypothetical protein
MLPATRYVKATSQAGSNPASGANLKQQQDGNRTTIKLRGLAYASFYST